MEDLNKNGTLTVGEWVVTLLITAIPLIGLIMLFVWAFSAGTNPNKANFAKAALIWVAIAILLNILVFAVFGAAFFSAFS